MQTEQAERVAEIVERALESEADERRPLILDLCRGDANLRTEVDSLLRFEEKARVFIEMPAFEVAAKIIADENGKLNPGEQLGNYKIVSLLGEGGMGEVYLAEDTTLSRRVAIKLLKPGRGATSSSRKRTSSRLRRSFSVCRQPTAPLRAELNTASMPSLPARSVTV